MSDVTNPICTFDPECGKTAIVSYTWPWGESGLACPAHQVVVHQRAEQLKREVHVVSLQPGAERPVTRDERIQTKARILTLEAELEEAKVRGMELYRSNESLQALIKVEQAKRAELEAQLAGANRALEEAQVANGHLLRQAADENSELQQLRALVTQPTPPAPQKLDEPPEP